MAHSRENFTFIFMGVKNVPYAVLKKVRWTGHVTWMRKQEVHTYTLGSFM
jgi:hypothetical protein